MSATPQSVQAHLDKAIINLKASTTSMPYMIRTYGKDWTKWPKTNHWYIAFFEIAAARKEAGTLVVPHLIADFTVK